MKQLSAFNKIMFFLNIICGMLLLASYVIPYLDPEVYSAISVLSLSYPFILVCNLFFIFYWLLKFELHFLLSTVITVIGLHNFNSFISLENKEVFLNDDIKLMSFNVRQFNVYNWINSPTVKQDICDFINREKVDILTLQDAPVNNYTNSVRIRLKHQYISTNYEKSLRTYASFPIINAHTFIFKNSGNTATYCDLKLPNDTIRVYNIHLQSFKLHTSEKYFGKNSQKELLSVFQNTFKQQAIQVKTIQKSIKESPYKTIIMGDFNNTAFSWHYKQLKENKKDAFVEAGIGLGRTFNHMVPLRIDFILVDDQIKVNHFKKYNLRLSDHAPIAARINLDKKL